MKIRSGFVSNSSSSSFLLELKDITIDQRDFLCFHEEKLAKKGWEIIYCFPVIFGWTAMDNFDLKEYLAEKNFPVEKMIWFHSNNELPKDCLFEKSLETWLEKKTK